MDQLNHSPGHDHATAPATGDTTRDPVCGMTVDPAAGKPEFQHGARTIYFCSPGCKDKFAAAPEDYLAATDPVCGMQVDRPSADHMAKHAGTRVFFCSSHCMTRFEDNPEAFADALPKPAEVAVPSGTRWICPMDPEIDEDGPGDFR